jgi:hypothetical protein
MKFELGLPGRAPGGLRDGNPFILVSASRTNSIKPGWRKPLPVLVRINLDVVFILWVGIEC